MPKTPKQPLFPAEQAHLDHAVRCSLYDCETCRLLAHSANKEREKHAMRRIQEASK